MKPTDPPANQLQRLGAGAGSIGIMTGSPAKLVADERTRAAARLFVIVLVVFFMAVIDPVQVNPTPKFGLAIARAGLLTSQNRCFYLKNETISFLSQIVLPVGG
jgi:hypothetical protein